MTIIGGTERIYKLIKTLLVLTHSYPPFVIPTATIYKMFHFKAFHKFFSVILNRAEFKYSLELIKEVLIFN